MGEARLCDAGLLCEVSRSSAQTSLPFAPLARHRAWRVMERELQVANTWIVDLRHYLTPAGTLVALSTRGRVLAEYFTQIVAQGSNVDEPAALRCRRRPRRRACAGVLEICLDLDLDGMVWQCPVCGDNGVIRGWQGTFWDNSENPESAS
jgi:hypothetical protein